MESWSQHTKPIPSNENTAVLRMKTLENVNQLTAVREKQLLARQIKQNLLG